MNKRRLNRVMHRILIAGASLFAAALIGLTALFWNFNRPPFDLRKLDKLTVGMTHEQVRDLLGEPTVKQDDGNWTYSRLFAWPTVYIYFDADGKLARHRYDF